jgi:hypothetical protein
MMLWVLVFYRDGSVAVRMNRGCDKHYKPLGRPGKCQITLTKSEGKTESADFGWFSKLAYPNLNRNHNLRIMGEGKRLAKQSLTARFTRSARWSASNQLQDASYFAP